MTFFRSWPARGLAAVLAAAATGCANVTPAPAFQADCPVVMEAALAAPGSLAAGCTDMQAQAIREALGLLSAHGLDPATYPDADPAAAWRLAATHLRHGAVDRETLTPRRQADPSLAGLPPASSAAGYRAALEAMAPASPLYAALKAELARQMAARPVLADAGAIDLAEAQIASLRASLERLRWLPRETAEREVYANIPGFDVIAFSGGAEVSRRAAIIGQMNHQTPEFSDSIDYIVFNPWWDVPDSIARRDKLAQFRRDPGSIQRLGYQILDRAGKKVNAASIDWASVSAAAFPYRIRQAPGPANALGQVKLIFPNPYNVYLHDTPDRSLFAETQRTFSSGCIRVENPVELAVWVLEDTPGWDRARIDAALASGAETRATLAAPVPVHIVYLTAFPAADGHIVYAPDVYGRDAPLLEALGGFPATLPPGAPVSGDCFDPGQGRGD
ncbi:murein L,D-transpeptidase [Hyphomonas sp.]|uniref:L,D-transpeptidase family protein n=1 Tax=Hyphomonas sp. TaxID=87 RepID=UPI003918B3C2